MVDDDVDDGMDPIGGDNDHGDNEPLLAFGVMFPPLIQSNATVSLSSLAPLVAPFALQCTQVRVVYATRFVCIV
jgi:hypothetical protein